MPPKVREVIGRLEREGWHLDRMRGSHRIYKHPDKPGTVVVAGHPNSVMPAGTWDSTQKQADWK